MPNFATSAALVETATKCFATASASRRGRPSSQARAALRIGHRLQRREGLRGDDEQRLGRVEVAGGLGEIGRHRRWRRSGTSAPGRCSAAAPRTPSTGPRSEPPMPMLTTFRMRRPVWPFHVAAAGRGRRTPPSGRARRAPSGTTFSPSTRIDASARRAQRHVQDRAVLGDVDACRRGTSRRSARAGRLLGQPTSSRSVSSVTRFFE